MSFAPLSQIDKKNVIGYFEEREFKKSFEYSPRTAEDIQSIPGWERFDKLIYTGPTTLTLETRKAQILETVAYIVVDENADGSPVVEKWFIKNHRHYNP